MKFRTPATKLEYKQNKDGLREYVVQFNGLISNFHWIRETKTLTFKAAGRYGLLHYGDDRAAALAFTAYTAYLHHADVSLRFGCGSLKLDGFHGDERGEFYVYQDVSTFCAQCKSSSVDPSCEPLSTPRYFAGTRYRLMSI